MMFVTVPRGTWKACIKLMNETGDELSIAFNRRPKDFGLDSTALCLDNAMLFPKKGHFGVSVAANDSHELVESLARHLGYKLVKTDV